MRKIKKIGLKIAFCLATTAAWGQQYPLFTNYITNNYGFNPAVTGASGITELKGVVRTQWVNFDGAPQTQLLAFQSRVKKSPIGIGLNFSNDQAGYWQRTGLALNLAVHQKLGEQGLLSLGVSGGYQNVKIREGFLAIDLPNDQTLLNALGGVWQPDLNVGVSLRLKSFWAGFSVPQILNKKIVFDPRAPSDTVTRLERHYYASAGYGIKISEKMVIEPSLLFKYHQRATPQYDVALRAIFNKQFWVGGLFRTEDAFAAMVGIDKNKYSISYAYDVTTSRLKEKSAGSHEISMAYRFGQDKCKDKDGDGICDKEDKCPDEPGKKEDNGCPKKEEKKKDCEDKDNDGLCDKDDKCPDEAGPKSNKGCPFLDRDSDGVRDDLDKCPDIPGTVKNEGCPLSDRDHDGILDEADPCPDEAGPVSNSGCPLGNDRDKDGTPDVNDPCPDEVGPKSNKGCPDTGDMDKDGVADKEDKCPNTAGEKENGGCPIVQEDEKEILDLAIQNLYFDTDKWAIRPSSYRNLNNLALLLKKKKDWKVEITGHADTRGSIEHNNMLSRNRATAVRNYLISKGVSPNSLKMEYYGARKPAEDGKTPEKLQLSRRVELQFLFD